jgi:hypothetical protein
VQLLTHENQLSYGNTVQYNFIAATAIFFLLIGLIGASEMNTSLYVYRGYVKLSIIFFFFFFCNGPEMWCQPKWMVKIGGLLAVPTTQVSQVTPRDKLNRE